MLAFETITPGTTSFIRSLVVWIAAFSQAAAADGTTSTAGPYLRMLKSGRLPANRLVPVIELVCRRGSADDLAYVYQQAIDENGFPASVRVSALQSLGEAADSRNMRPSGDLSGLKPWITATNKQNTRAVRILAIHLAGLWGERSLVPALKEILAVRNGDERVRLTALESLSLIGGPECRMVIERWIATARSHRERGSGVAALARLDLDAAAVSAAQFMSEATDVDDPAAFVAPFLDRKDGSDRLAAALSERRPPVDIAKLALRYMYSVGRTDEALASVLADTAGIDNETQPINKADLDRLIADVLQTGDALRGERVMLRTDLSCMKCHAVDGVGGQVGPDLVGLGGSSPLEYLVESIVLPDKAIKEQFQSMMVLTDDGEVLQGIVVEQNDERIVLKTSTAKNRVIPTEEIVDKKIGSSLMPKGLRNFLTRRELVDLVRFLSEVGKPGGPLHRSSPQVIRRWRMLKATHAGPARDNPGKSAFRRGVLDADPSAWRTVFASMTGKLSLTGLHHETDGDVFYLQGEIDVTAEGNIAAQIEAPPGTQLWVGDSLLDDQRKFVLSLSQGRHQITLRFEPIPPDDTGILTFRLIESDSDKGRAKPVGKM